MKHENIIATLANLAADAEDQVQYLESLGLPGYIKLPGVDLRNVDELALEFEDAIMNREVLFEQGKLTSQQVEGLAELDSFLNSMSGKAHSALWTIEALHTRREWEVVRQKARACLTLFEETPQ